MQQETFGSRFRALRTSRHLTQEKIAELFYLNTSSISKYEKNRSLPEINLLIQLADFFEVSVDYLLCRTDVPYKIETPENGLYLSNENQLTYLNPTEEKAIRQYFDQPGTIKAEITSFISFKAKEK